jgi:hypothetical protein
VPVPPGRGLTRHGALSRARKVVRVTIRGGGVLAAPAAPGSIGAVIARPPTTTPDCVAHYQQIVDLLTKQPELTALLERKPDPFDHTCISTAAIAHQLAQSVEAR